jgi:ubiquinone/menaquinone biosynthesis C-methylase UbiE
MSMIKEQMKTWLRNMWWRQAKHRFPQQAEGKTLLHIGCGQVNSPGYINIDARRFPHVHVVTKKITSLPLFPSDQADLIYMCHVLEHVTRMQVRAVLGEMRRILRPGGVLRISVPDFDRIIEIYSAAYGRPGLRLQLSSSRLQCSPPERSASFQWLPRGPRLGSGQLPIP